MITVPIDLLVAAAQRFLEEAMDRELAYHSVEHTLSVMNYSQLLSQKEHFSECDQAIVRLAAAYHDTGFSVMQKANEPIGSFLFASAIYYLFENRIISPVIQPIEHAADQAELDESTYLAKCVVKRDLLISLLADLQQEEGLKTHVEVDSTLEAFINRLTLMINSTALLKNEQDVIYRVPSESLTKPLLDADLSGLGTDAYEIDFEHLISERGLESMAQKMEFAQGSISLLQNHSWFTPSAHAMFHQQQAHNLAWTEAYIERLNRAMVSNSDR